MFSKSFSNVVEYGNENTNMLRFLRDFYVIHLVKDGNFSFKNYISVNKMHYFVEMIFKNIFLEMHVMYMLCSITNENIIQALLLSVILIYDHMHFTWHTMILISFANTHIFLTFLYREFVIESLEDSTINLVL